MRRPNIKTTLSAIFISIGLSVGAFSLYTLGQMDSTNAKVGEVVNTWMPALEMVKDIEVRLGDIRTAYRTHILQRDEAGKNAAKELMQNSVAIFEEDGRALERYSADTEQRQLLGEIRKHFAEYMKKGKEVLALSDAGRQDDAVMMLREVMMKRAEALKLASARLTDVTKAASIAAYDTAQADFGRTFIITIAAIALLLSMIAAAVWFVWQNVARPIERITASMKILANGDVPQSVPFSGRSDEVGAMAAVVEVFRANAVANARLESEANANRDAADRDRERQLSEQAERAQAMEQATAGLGLGLRRLAEGDLRYRLLETFAPDFERLRGDFNKAAETLRTTLSAVAQATDSIDGGSSEISQSVDDLSRRTEQQAAALEQTAAALDQITANVSQSAKRADEARQAASSARGSTDRSGRIVAEAVDAMVKIETSSDQIAGIIGVIDEIAFQTNLLALNAGVEAARAGEAGKGFAVVAQEVRELAQRSATAAREIKALIQQSGSDVENGVKLVRETGEALKIIDGHVQAINANMDAIATSAKEQSAGLMQVNTAVNQMDQVTQQNAAMVEEANAASASLTGETNRLRMLVNGFDLGLEVQVSPGFSPRPDLVSGPARAA